MQEAAKKDINNAHEIKERRILKEQAQVTIQNAVYGKMRCKQLITFQQIKKFCK